jgi:hypothetical protein
MRTTTLFRPVGPVELKLIEASGWRGFPPRLPGQPIFYPVVQEAYARAIARDWNVPASGSGFVTRFEVDADWLAEFPEQVAGGDITVTCNENTTIECKKPNGDGHGVTLAYADSERAKVRRTERFGATES